VVRKSAVEFREGALEIEIVIELCGTFFRRIAIGFTLPGIYDLHLCRTALKLLQNQ